MKSECIALGNTIDTESICTCSNGYAVNYAKTACIPATTAEECSTNGDLTSKVCGCAANYAVNW